MIGPGTAWGRTFGESALSAFAHDGRYYGVPLYNNGKFMGYNKSAFDKAGVDVPKTFEELIASCPELRKARPTSPSPSATRTAGPPCTTSSSSSPTTSRPTSARPTTTRRPPPGTTRATWSPSSSSRDRHLPLHRHRTRHQRRPLHLGAGGVRPGQGRHDYQEILEFDSTTSGGTLTPGDLGIFPLPAAAEAKGDPKVVEGAPEGYFVNARSPRAALAVDFMKFVTSAAHAKTLSPRRPTASRAPWSAR
ncbi:Sugar ABC transporter substrate-binding protein OS=Streptomyces glaucescens OX=1907 GN=SGLAU_31080 PE=4 SV=1 [Streptomyces glaucescens]